jgi:hypothetical protein
MIGKCYGDIKIDTALVLMLNELVVRLAILLFNLFCIVLSLFKLNELVFKLTIYIKE